MEECNYCQDRDSKIKQYYDEIEKEKLRECFNALERQKLVSGMECSRKDEVNLKKFQQLQIQEKRQIENESNDLELMWHQNMLENIRLKERQELMEAQRRHKEMLERRKAYDEQISSAASKRKLAIQEEREKENKRLEKIKKKMEEDHYKALKKKESEQVVNRNNFIEGHQMKLSRLQSERIKEREIDSKCIRDALEELHKERERKVMKMRKLQIENRIFTANYNRERKMAAGLEEETEKVADVWRKQRETKADEYVIYLEEEKRNIKQKELQHYKDHLENLRSKMVKAKSEQHENAERVRRCALEELKLKIDSADMELKSQIEYRDSLTNQIMDNQRYLKSELLNTEQKLMPFTRKATMFKDIMENRFNNSTARISTNPVHPFRRVIELKQGNGSIQLPSI